MRGWTAAFLFALLALPAGCGGRGQTPFPVESAYDTAVIQTSSQACRATYTVHRDGSALRSGATACGDGSKTIVLPSAVVSGFFSDLQAAQPLTGLTPCMTVDVSMTIAWDDQQSPNLYGECSGTSAAGQALSQQAGLVVQNFMPAP